MQERHIAFRNSVRELEVQNPQTRKEVQSQSLERVLHIRHIGETERQSVVKDLLRLQHLSQPEAKPSSRLT